MPVTINAGPGGFHFLGPTGERIAPEVFFADAFNPSGEIYQADAAQTWRTKESFTTGVLRVEAVLARDAALPPGARAGDQTELALTGFTFARVSDEGTEVIGQMDLGAIVSVDATFAPNGSAPIGGGAAPNWIAGVGTAVRDAFARDGFAFQGSDAADIYNPETGALPVFASGEIRGEGGDDILVAQAGGGTVHGGQGADRISANGGAHSIWGGSGHDEIDLSDLAAEQLVYGGLGRDTMIGGDGDDLLTGGGRRDLLQGEEGADALRGGRGNDTLAGGEGDDFLRAGFGADRLNGGFGADTLNGGNGDDRMIGGPGADTFVFSRGRDVIVDFDPEQDVIQATGEDGLNLKQTNRGVIVSFDGADGDIVLKGVSADDLSDANFLF